MPTTTNKLKRNFRISWILNVITVVGFLITIGTFVYIAGQKEARIQQLEKDVVELKKENKIIIADVNEQTKITAQVDAKLDLLLGHFDIVSGE